MTNLFRALSGFLLLVTSNAAMSGDWDGEGVTDFVRVEIDGWNLQCRLQIRDYSDPSKCFALYNLTDGNVILDYKPNGLTIQTIGSCGVGVKAGVPLSLPVADVAKEIEATARRPDHTCKPPILTAELFAGLRQLNTVATVLTQKQR